MRALPIALVIAALVPRTVECQTPSTGPLTRADLTVAAGAFFSTHGLSSDSCCGNDWSSSLTKGVSGGYYWTDHMKTEVDAAWPGSTQEYRYVNTRASDGTFLYSNDEHTFRTFNLSAGQLYQFGRNSFFHPFAGGGVAVIGERDRVEHTTETSRGAVQNRVSETSSIRARPFLTTGFKTYFSERAFFRGELKVDFGRRVEQVIWKAGFGVDF